MRRLAEEQHPWLHERGLASLLASGPEPDGDDTGDDYSDYAGAPGLAGLLHYESPRTEQPHGYVTKKSPH